MKLITYEIQRKYNYFHLVLWNDRRELCTENISCRYNDEYNYLMNLVFNDNEHEPDNDIVIKKFLIRCFMILETLLTFIKT